MRYNLYRAKRVDNGEWVYGDLIHEPYGTVIQYYIKDEGDCVKQAVKVTVIPDTVCQYTGLTDKNGRKIFEGDILRFDDYRNCPVFWDSDYCAFGSILYSDFDHLSEYRNTKIEVVGNIFDTLPHLRP